jgi:DMSO/TMAO reductase YedYZ molybdopterin-dependent catalytic subunit
MHDRDVQPSGLTRRRVLGGMGIASLALMSSPVAAQETVDLHVPGGPSTRMITTSYPQKGRMILQRSTPPWLETPFEVFDKGVFTPNDQHYVSWHWANFPGDINVDSFRLTVRGQVNRTLSLSLKDIFAGLAEIRYRCGLSLTPITGRPLATGCPIRRTIPSSPARPDSRWFR